MPKKRIILIIILLLIILSIYFKIPQKMIYPTKFENYVEKYSEEYQVDKYLIYAIIKAESNFDEKAVSGKGAKGLMQLMDNTAKYIARTGDVAEDEDLTATSSENIGESLLNPEFSIKLGAKYISILIKKYNSIELALVAYNAGSGNVDNWLEQGVLKADGSNIEDVPYKETNNYVRKILRDYNIYKELYSI